MEKLLGEAVKATEVKEKQLVWHEGAFQLVTEVSEDDGQVVFNFLGGSSLYVGKEDNVIRGWRFLVGRRIN
jgi:hypothetical protein